MGEGQQHAGMGRPREAERITGPEESESTGYVPQAIKHRACSGKQGAC